MPRTPSNGDSVEKAELTPIVHDFNREDLNELRDKVNELISLANA